MDAIAATTGLGKGSLYGAFGDKRALYHRVLDRYCETVARAAEHDLSGDDPGALRRLRAFLMAPAGGSRESRARGCFLAKGTAELSTQDDAVSVRSRSTLQSVQDAIRGNLEACQRAGDLAADADLTQLSAHLLTVHRGIEALGRAGVDQRTLRASVEVAIAQLPTVTTR